jgi:hypothetical protein
MKRALGALALALACAAPALADAPIAQVNNQESLAIGIVPLHASDVAQDKSGAVFVNHAAGTRFVLGYDAARTRTIFGIPDLYTDLDAAVGVATVRYDGTILDTNAQAAGGVNEAATYVEESVRLRLGRTWSFFKTRDAALTPFLGFVQKAWGRDSPSSSIAYAYAHEGLEAGALAQVSLPGNLVAGADAAVGRVMGAVLFNGAGNRLFAGARSFSLKLDHRTFADWHQRLEVRGNFLRYGSVTGVSGFFEPRRSNDIAILFEIGGETSVF